MAALSDNMGGPGRAAFPDATSPSLLVRVQANQAGAWERLVDLYAPLVYHWCRRSALPAEDAADVFQEVFRALAVHIGGFRRDRAGDTFRGWLRTITRNKIRDHFRRQEGRPQAAGGTDAQMQMLAVAEPGPADDDDPAEANLVHGQVRRTLETLRGEFEERTWRAFWAVQIDGRDTADVGAELGMTAAAVRKAKLRVLRRMREELGDLLD
jgi:RNA polymerase sigma-70 factor (ECF subfamily)